MGEGFYTAIAAAAVPTDLRVHHAYSSATKNSFRADEDQSST